MRQIVFLLAVSLCFQSQVFSETGKEKLGMSFLTPKDEPGSQKSSLPILGAKGKERIGHNLKIIKDNLKVVENNLHTTDQNIKTLSDRHLALKNLLEENQSHKAGLESYLAQSRSDEIKNDATLKALEQKSRDLAAEEANRVEKDMAQHQDWKEDATPKVEKVKELLEKAQLNIASIEAELPKVKASLDEWTLKRENYLKMKSGLINWQKQYEKFLAKK